MPEPCTRRPPPVGVTCGTLLRSCVPDRDTAELAEATVVRLRLGCRRDFEVGSDTVKSA